ncbi:hypothetical protein ABL840_04930 [Variovorax sp. NFACC27]|uniref:hypothetical protein n=1 Tax=unclassified Variovorax TaxID=663243 RepID=UPI000894784E|nr:hypothetical protein SAMN03159371_00120 [Variovorax sp. NFACC28]SEF72425.1 hypothetical protein SAMN03159365_00697 [Variovorax sp. NFACC29]SFB77205.1 hypothetical protein SAMN03159379_00696 [Variovorax sp. NFACC26]SFG76833.1 hypothetical protein SAMN03159447_04819 [Variovorax sp. NFACC27]
MNTRHPAQAPAHDPDLIHTSSRSTISTNASPTPGQPPRITLRTTRLDVRWQDGDVVLRFVAHEVAVAPTARTLQRRSSR